MNAECDIAVIGSGFAGSLMAMIVHQSGLSTIMIERGKHPRFVIGESSTPLANLLMEDLARRYALPGVTPLAKWGAWQKQCQHIPCGLKRGFTFYHHELDRPWREDRQMLVAASPHDNLADTHWYRQEFDAHLVKQAQDLGVRFLDEVRLDDAHLGSDVTLRGEQAGQPLTIRARLVVDASGSRGCLHQLLNLLTVPLAHLPPTQAIYSHFRGVDRWQDLFPSPHLPPYPPDDAALHHVFPGGWIWVLRFNNGLTSAGAAFTPKIAGPAHDGAPLISWQRLLARLPSVGLQFKQAQPVRPLVWQQQLSFRATPVSGPGWVLLPSAAGFIDPLLSTGFPLTLLGVERLASLITQGWGSTSLSARLQSYAQQTERELILAELLIAALYTAMDNPELFGALSLLYFAAASYTETVRRLGRPELAGPTFLCADHPVFGPRLLRCLRRALEPLSPSNRIDLIEEIYAAIEPIDVAGLGDRSRRPWYPVLAQDLLQAADKVKAGRDEIQRMLVACGFVLD